MKTEARPAAVEEIRAWRDLYRAEMDCQIIHDSLHCRKGWTQSYLLRVGEAVAGYGAVAIGGPWEEKPALFEFYVGQRFRARTFDLFEELLEKSTPLTIETQSNDPHLFPLLQLYGKKIEAESILWADAGATALTAEGAVFRQVSGDDVTRMLDKEREPGSEWVVEWEGEIAACGGLLFHYNRPYGDVWMEVNEPFRGRGLGAFLTQELKRVAYESGHVPAARCNPRNVASRRTLQRAGFAPCGVLLKGQFGGGE